MEPAPELATAAAESRQPVRLGRFGLQVFGALRKLTPEFTPLRPPVLREGLHRVAGWAHIAAALPPLAADFVKPIAPYGILWVLAGALAALAVLLIAVKARKLAADTAAAIVVFFMAATLYSLCVIALEGYADDPKGALAHASPAVEEIQRSLLRIERQIDAVKDDTAALVKGQQEEKARADARQAEAMAGQKKLERLIVDGAGGGAVSVQAVAEIRDLLRPGNPEIDNISADLLPGLVKRILGDLQKPGANPNDFSGMVKHALTEAQARVGELAFADAARVLDAALAQAEVDDQGRARGRAALLAERGRVAGLQLRYREAASYYGQASAAVAFDPASAWNYTLDMAAQLTAQGDEFGDNTALDEAIRVDRAVLDLAPRERVPLDWAMTQHYLGVALATLGERESGTAHLEEAVAAYRAALEERTRERVPLDWAMTQNNLGTALWTLGERESGTAHLEEAVAAHRAALEERTRERVPLGWAMTQGNLGGALEALGERESGTARLKEAVAAHRAALQEDTRERVPLDWAITQNNLGIALQALGERESGTARLEEAVGAYDAALAVFIAAKAKYYVEGTRANRKEALQLIAERRGGRK
jgi:tetratricopeptide (TPR) repeat protein